MLFMVLELLDKGGASLVGYFLLLSSTKLKLKEEIKASSIFPFSLSEQVMHLEGSWYFLPPRGQDSSFYTFLVAVSSSLDILQALFPLSFC